MSLRVVLSAVSPSLAAAFRTHCGELPGVDVVEGSILDLSVDAVVSPANSFGFMDGGLDALYARRFGVEVVDRVRRCIAERHHGELVVGQADVVETGDGAIPWLVVAPTMRVPMVLRDSVNPYLAARAALLLATRGTLPDGRRCVDVLRSLAFPGLGTGVGQVGDSTAAHQMACAVEDVLLGKFEPPRTWAEASERHQLLYGARVRRLQDG